jgi:hypothetical protein
MKRNRSIFILVAVLFLTTLATGALLLSYHSSMRNLQSLKQQMALINNTQSILPSLNADISEYAKKNPSISNFLQSVMGPPPSVAPAAGPVKPLNK